MRTLTHCALIVTALLSIAGCQSSSHSGSHAIPSDLQRRAAMLRGTTETAWKSVGQALARGEKVDPLYVHKLGDLRYAALSIEVRTAIASSSEREEATQVITKMEEVLPKFLSLPRDQPPTTPEIGTNP